MSTRRLATIALIVIGFAVAAVIGWPHVRGRDRASGDATSEPSTAPTETSGPNQPTQPGLDHRRSSGTTTRTTPDVAAEPTQVSVTGHVQTAGTLDPVPWVDVIFSSERSEWTATSDADGSYALVLPPGTYDVAAVGDLVIGIGLPELEVASAAKTYDIAVARRAQVRGRARYRDGSPASGAVVVAYTNAKSVAALAAKGELGTADVRADGTFELLTAPQEMILRASDGSASGRARTGKLAPGQHVDGVEIVLVPNGYVAGVVVDQAGDPVANADVLVSVEAPGTGDYDRVPQVADSRGRFRWDLPRPGAIIVEASASGFAQSAPVAFTLEPGESRAGIELVLNQASFQLAGRVVDEQGEPLAYVQIAQGVEGSKARYKRTLTNSEGAFEIGGLGRGPHRLRARKAGYQQTRARQIAAPKTDIEIVMPRALPSTR